MEALGKRLKALRKSRGLSQADLARGICTQSNISRIEKGQHTPTSHILDLFAKRLDIDLNYLYSGIENYNLEEFKNKVYDCIEYADYTTLKHFVDDMNLESKTEYEKKIKLWIKAVVMYRCDEDIEGAKRYIKKADNIESEVSDPNLEIQILNSISIILREDFSENEIEHLYERIFNIIEKNPLPKKIVIKVLLSMSNYYYHAKVYRYVHQNAKKAIDILKKANSMYLLEHHLYNYASSLYYLNEYTPEMHEYMKLAYQICIYKDNNELMEYIEEMMDNVSDIIEREA
ncbi:helix-turn-helix domain-containing protein [Macrococcoides bohemicum]|uniref:helix-turn-helix domain-containing protein n=1 Tax=Macrococcoides bohemicum TaxID=1903056 RepID=UPI00165D425B|nr:helix-turn-helix transcriptional regulator [Macrococcus bohemicus]MBC9875554.1 helix-turn-helix transcriptional regulator [Macrococcus bohemicus]